ncbi:hypothetical protein AWJ20_3482 [Sugiyamaella lignohabitans]|uniref:Spermatogenesis-associated protein 20-like TRX domain-containing protein n=1 Tax=Sugiyamaella lignohabitans TaxID=796027 RepID=A0A167FXU1_9ASCO|nr:uncharacterized protein AWJ20_3482 [Sugiyamaella lignohabitans]ANB15838.1 hypothetical protein AWJ20_3482 [Sugiyamaella lignohabitans]
MNKESFSNDAIAKLINDSFIPIKVDREERPDVDSVYMMYLQATTGQGGWPLNVFLVPGTLDPIYGGTYWAGPEADMGERAAKFEDVLKRVADIWKAEQQKCISSAKATGEQLAKLVKMQSSSEHNDSFNVEAIVDDVREHFSNNFDSQFGGFSHAPKFPCPHNMSLLLKYNNYFDKGLDKQELLQADKSMTGKVLYTLESIGKGGIKDQIGHGFSRYSVTDNWNLPHFEKMLYDQALLLNAYLDAYVYSGSLAEFASYYANDIVEFLMKGSLTDKHGDGFYSAQDADSMNKEGEHSEGAYYVWTYKEFFGALEHLGRVEADICAMYWNVQEYGNVDPQYDIQKELQFQNVLSEQVKLEDVARAFGKPVQEVDKIIQRARFELEKYRNTTRQKPDVDTKIIVSWNGLAIGALARASVILGNKQALSRALKAADYIYEHGYDKSTGRLRRSIGSEVHGMNDDYAYLISGLIELYEATFDIQYIKWADHLQQKQLQLFWDKENGGFFSVEATRLIEEQLIFRPKSGFDSAEPSPNGVSASNLQRLSSILGNVEYESKAFEVIKCYGQDLSAQPFGYTSMVGPVITALESGMRSIVIVGEDNNLNGHSSQVEAILYKLHVEHPHPLTTIVRLDEHSIDYFNKLEDTIYKEVYEQFGGGSLKVLLCQDRACREFSF